MVRRRPALPRVLLLLTTALAVESLAAFALATDSDATSSSRRSRRLANGASEGYNFMFYFVIGAMMLTCLIYNIFFKHKMEAGFLRQHALPETMLRQDVIARCVLLSLCLGVSLQTTHARALSLCLPPATKR